MSASDPDPGPIRYPPPPSTSGTTGPAPTSSAAGADTGGEMSDDSLKSSAMSQGDGTAIGEEGEPSAAPGDVDIEHLLVEDDPRQWSPLRKNLILSTIAFTAMSGTISTNVFFPAISSLTQDLNATAASVSGSISLFILFQGATPVLWSGLSELVGRRIPYVASLLLYCGATAGCASANSIGVFIVLRILQACGSSAVLALGAGTLADIFDSHERGARLGIYYLAPLLGPSVGPLIGGALTLQSSWRSTFYFLLGYGVACLALMLWLPETFRKERSLAYIRAVKSARSHQKAALLLAHSSLPTPAPSTAPSTTARAGAGEGEKGARATFALEVSPSKLERVGTLAGAREREVEGGFSGMARVLSRLSGRSSEDKIKIRFRDVNPFAAVGQVLRQKHNLVATLVSGLLFASQYAIAYTVAISFAAPPYNYTSLQVGLVLLSYGAGNIVGSIAGGRFSDVVLRRLKEANGGQAEPEMRIRSTKIAIWFVPTSLIVYAWTVEKQVNVAVPVIALFALGLATIWIYTSTLAYIVDANPGRSSSAVACNSLARGTLAAIASEVSEPIIGRVGYGIGQGWFYTGFAVILAVALAGLLMVAEKGGEWRGREGILEKEKERALEKTLMLERERPIS